MKIICITSYTFPSRRAEPYYLRSMAKAFTEHLGNDFTFLIRGNISSELEGTNAVSVKLPRRLRSFFYFFWFFISVLRRGWNNNEILFFSNDPYILIICIFWRKILRFKYRVCSDWHQLFDDWKDMFIAKNSDYLISTSERLKGFLVNTCSINPEKILVAYGGIDPNLFVEKRNYRKEDLRTKLGLPIDSFLVGYIGGFRSVGLEKGLSTMIKALPYLAEHIKMVFIGGSKEHIDEYRILAKGLQVEHRCIFFGKQVFERVIEFELSMDVLAIPYPDQHHFRDYGFPMKVWEYMASGRPIVYSNLEIINEILSSRASSFTPDDVHDLAKVLTSVCDNIEPAQRIAQKNIQDTNLYTWNARVTKIMDFIGT